MDSFEIRRVWLASGGNTQAAAAVLSEMGHPITRQGVHKHVQRANRLRPLSVEAQPLRAQEGTERADLEALAEYVRQCLEAAGIQRP